MNGRRRYVPVVHGAVDGRPDEADTAAATDAVAAALARLGYDTEVLRVDLDLGRLEALRRSGPCAVFNMVEALEGNCALAHLVPAVLEHFGLACTGAPSQALAATACKIATKRILAVAGIPTPAWSADGSGLPAGAPVIVKSASEHGSLGIDGGSVVDAARAREEIAAREARFGGRFFAETFIDGREFNVALLDGGSGPELLPVAEIMFDGFAPGVPRVVDYRAKWDEGSFAYVHTPRRFDFPDADSGLLDDLRRLALAAWDVLGLSGYARIDFRVDAAGRPFVLEANPNPGLGADAGFVAQAARAGIGFDRLIERIVMAAVASVRRQAA